MLRQQRGFIAKVLGKEFISGSGFAGAECRTELRMGTECDRKGRQSQQADRIHVESVFPNPAFGKPLTDRITGRLLARDTCSVMESVRAVQTSKPSQTETACSRYRWRHKVVAKLDKCQRVDGGRKLKTASSTNSTALT